MPMITKPRALSGSGAGGEPSAGVHDMQMRPHCHGMVGGGSQHGPPGRCSAWLLGSCALTPKSLSSVSPGTPDFSNGELGKQTIRKLRHVSLSFVC